MFYFILSVFYAYERIGEKLVDVYNTLKAGQIQKLCTALFL